MKSLIARDILKMSGDAKLSGMVNAILESVRSGNVPVSIAGLSDAELKQFNALVGEKFVKSIKLAAQRGSNGHSLEIAKELKADAIYAKMVELEKQYTDIASKDKRYKSSGFGGMVLYIRAK